MIQVSKEDYLVVKHNNRNKLVYVLNPGSCRGIVNESLATDEPENVEYEQEDILCNLGASPKPGKIYGVNVNPFVKTIETKRFGPIHLFRNLNDKEMKSLKKGMKRAYAKFEEHAVTRFLPLSKICVYPKRGKHAGMYYAKTKGDEVTDWLDLYPETFEDAAFNEYMLCHEFAHGLWYRCVPSEIKVKWLALYQKRLHLSTVTGKDLEDLCEAVVKYGSGVRDYMKEVAGTEEKEGMILKEVLSYFKRYHRMSAQDVDAMLSYDSEKFADMWPTAATLSEPFADISKYSLTSVEEFFAEAVAYFMVGFKLPKDVQKGLDATFKKCRSR